MGELASRLPTVVKLDGKPVWKFWMVLGGVLATVALFALAASYATFPGDKAALEGFQDNRTGWLDTAALNITKLGGGFVAGGMVAASVLALLSLRRWADALAMLLCTGPIGIGLLLKDVVGRARPDFFIAGVESSSLSFPSGHSLFAIIFGGLLMIMIGEMVLPVKVRRAIQGGLALMVLAVGASRVYLGLHWPSDVVGAYLFGFMAVLGLIWLRNRLRRGSL